MNTISIITFILATGSVAFFTYRIVQKMKRSDNATEEYFTGGRALTWPVVAGSLLLTNLSTEQLVGLNGDVCGDKALVGLAWEALAAFEGTNPLINITPEVIELINQESEE